MRRILIDTGPIVAYFNKADNRYQEFRNWFDTNDDEWLLPDTIFSEVCSLLRDLPHTEAEFIGAVADGAFKRVTLTDSDVHRIYELVRKYQDRPLGGNDVSIIAIAERLRISEILTIDLKDFTIVKPKHREYFNLLP